MVQSGYYWVHRPTFRLYSGLAIGPGLKRTSFTEPSSEQAKTNPVFAYHVNMLGVRFGKTIGFFLEGGIGWNGLLIAGVSGAF